MMGPMWNAWVTMRKRKLLDPEEQRKERERIEQLPKLTPEQQAENDRRWQESFANAPDDDEDFGV